MLALSGKFSVLDGFSDDSPREMHRISTNQALPRTLAASAAYLCDGGAAPPGYALYLATERHASTLKHLPPGTRKGVLPDAADFLRDGDIIRLSPTNRSYRVYSGQREQ